MWTALSPIQKRLSKLLKYQEIYTDNWLFRLHCILTVAILMGSSVILTTTQVVGKPISCITSQSERTKEWAKPIETFCWVNSTFLMPVEINKEVYNNKLLDELMNAKGINTRRRTVGKDMAYPGVYNEEDADGNPKRFYTYYQWVCFVLFLQGLMCYVPRALWKLMEGGLLTKLATGLKASCQREDREKRTDSIVCYLLRYRREHTAFALSYWFCEGLCLVNLVAQMWAMNQFLGGHFWKMGSETWTMSGTSQYERDDPLIYIFPRVTKCTFYYSGPSGSVVNLDNLCVLPLNIINEKVYVILWFWYIILAVLFSLMLIYRVLLVAMPSLRPRMLALRNRCVSIEDASEITSMVDLGDWWLLYMLAKNIDPLVYRDLVSDFVKRGKKSTLFN